MSIVNLVEKQYFIVNLETVDIADVMINNEDKSEEEVKLEDTSYLSELLNEKGIVLDSLNEQEAEIFFDKKARALFVELHGNVYRLSMLEFLEYDRYKKITNYFLKKTAVVLKNCSEKIGGIIDKNYGFKFMISL